MQRIIILFLGMMLGFLPMLGRGGKSKEVAYKISTEQYGKGVKGYGGPVPVEVTFYGGKIVGVKALPNSETPAYFRKVVQSGFLDKWNGMSIREACEREVDAVSGATLSSKALIENVRIAARKAQKR